MPNSKTQTEDMDIRLYCKNIEEKATIEKINGGFFLTAPHMLAVNVYFEQQIFSQLHEIITKWSVFNPYLMFITLIVTALAQSK